MKSEGNEEKIATNKLQSLFMLSTHTASNLRKGQHSEVPRCMDYLGQEGL